MSIWISPAPRLTFVAVARAGERSSGAEQPVRARNLFGNDATLLDKGDLNSVNFNLKNLGDTRNVDLALVTLEIVNLGEEFDVRTKPAIETPPPPKK